MSEAADALAVDDEVRRAGEEGEAAVALRKKMAGGKGSTAPVVRNDDGDAAFRQAAHGEDHGNAGRLDLPEGIRPGAASRRDDQAGDALLQHGFQHLLLPHRAFRRIGDEGHDAGGLEGALHADRQFRIEGVSEVVHHHADDVGIRFAKIGGAAVVDVARLLDRLAHLAGGVGADQAAAL